MEMVAHSQGDSRSGSEFEIAIERLDPTPDWEELPNIFAHTHTHKNALTNAFYFSLVLPNLSLAS